MVDGSLLGTAIWYNHQPIIASGSGARWGGPPTPRDARVPTMNAYRTKDGRFISLVFVNDQDLDWVDLCEHLNRPDLAFDARFATASARSTNRAAGVALLDDLFAQRTLEEWKKTLVTRAGESGLP